MAGEFFTTERIKYIEKWCERIHSKLVTVVTCSKVGRKGPRVGNDGQKIYYYLYLNFFTRVIVHSCVHNLIKEFKVRKSLRIYSTAFF